MAALFEQPNSGGMAIADKRESVAPLRSRSGHGRA